MTMQCDRTKRSVETDNEGDVILCWSGMTLGKPKHLLKTLGHNSERTRAKSNATSERVGLMPVCRAPGGLQGGFLGCVSIVFWLEKANFLVYPLKSN